MIICQKISQKEVKLPRMCDYHGLGTSALGHFRSMSCIKIRTRARRTINGVFKVINRQSMLPITFDAYGNKNGLQRKGLKVSEKPSLKKKQSLGVETE